MFVKICGITHPDDARSAVAAGADAVGLNFVPTSRRCIDLNTARAIVDAVPEHVMTVGIFHGHGLDEILEIISVLGLKVAQLHGDYAPAVNAAIRTNVQTLITVAVAARAMSGPLDADDVVMVDAPNPGQGVPFDWGLVGDLVTTHKILLAGGLRPDNVSDAIRRVRPWGVDVATGVEAPDGRKDPNAIARFVAAARTAKP